MKLCLINRFILLGIAVGLMVVGRASAQTFTNLHTFSGLDGSTPYSDLIISGNTLFGTTKAGGSANNGAVFRINTDGSGFTNLYSFTGGTDGASPYGGLVLLGNMLYGTAPEGGIGNKGTVFRVSTNGTDFSVLHTFSSATNDAVGPYGGLVLSGETLYGTASYGGPLGWGTVFAISTSGTGYTNLHGFALDGIDGFYPNTGLALVGDTLYGSTQFGGVNPNAGTLFKVKTDGTGYVQLYNFLYGDDGANVGGTLVVQNDRLYGTTTFGGSSNYGTVFGINTNGTGFITLKSLTGGFGEANTFSGVALAGNTLYGTAYLGGAFNEGTVFKVNTDGSGFNRVHSFRGTTDGANLWGGLLITNNTIYGTASAGGAGGSMSGTIFRIVLPVSPPLTIIRSGTNVVVTWPTNTAGFSLQSTTNLSPAVWSVNPTAPTVVNGQNTVTNATSGTQKFYRLYSPF